MTIDEALRPFLVAARRIELYSSPQSTAKIIALEDNCEYELHAKADEFGDKDELLTVAHLLALREACIAQSS